MEKIILIVFCCVLSLSCSTEQALVASKNLGQTSVSQKEPEFENLKLIRIAPAQETGKFSFHGTALLENDKILAIGYDGENIWNIRISTDKGQKWKIQPFTTDTETFPDSMYFADNQHGWIGGAMGVFRTVDGGDTWEKAGFDRYLRWTNLSFYNYEIGYLVGKNNIKGEIAGEIWMTKDGGRTWKRSYTSEKWTTPFSIVAISENVAIAVFNEKYLIRTVDGGKSWSQITSYDYRTYKLALDRKGRLWSVGHDGVFFFSSDQGLTWQRPTTLPTDVESTDWSSISFANDKLGFAVGDNGAFAVTQDGGATWERVPLNLTETFYDVLTNHSFGIINGSENIYKFGF
jgi:photosystem II stability/assembly factor-like uncharacterized protein